MIKKIITVSFTCLLCAILSTCKKNEMITIGVNAELTGSIPVAGKSCVNAAKMAAAETNMQGGITVDGRPREVEILVEDNEDRAESAAAIAQKFVSRGVSAMIGPNASRNAIPAAVVAEDNRLIMFSPWSTIPKLTEKKKYIFRPCFNDDFQGVVVAAFIYKKLNARRAAVLFDVASEYNKGIAEVFKTEFTKAGGWVSSFESYTSGDKDFTAQLVTIKNSGAEVLFLPNYYNEIPLQVRQARQHGFAGLIVGSDSWGSDELLKLGRDIMEGCYFTAHYAPDMATDRAKKFIAAYLERYGSKPDDVAALTYDAFNILFESLKKAGSRDTEKVRGRLSNLSEFQGVTGTMKFTPGSGSPKKSAVVIKIHDNAFRYFDVINPL